MSRAAGGGYACSRSGPKPCSTTFRGVSQQDKVKSIYGWQTDGVDGFFPPSDPWHPPGLQPKWPRALCWWYAFKIRPLAQNLWYILGSSNGKEAAARAS